MHIRDCYIYIYISDMGRQYSVFMYIFEVLVLIKLMGHVLVLELILSKCTDILRVHLSTFLIYTGKIKLINSYKMKFKKPLNYLLFKIEFRLSIYD